MSNNHLNIDINYATLPKRVIDFAIQRKKLHLLRTWCYLKLHFGSNAGYIPTKELQMVLGGLGVSRATFFRHVKELKEWGLLTVDHKDNLKLRGTQKFMNDHNLGTEQFRMKCYDFMMESNQTFKSSVYLYLISRRVKKNHYLYSVKYFRESKTGLLIDNPSYHAKSRGDKGRVISKQSGGISVNFLRTLLGVGNSSITTMKRKASELGYARFQPHWVGTGVHHSLGTGNFKNNPEFMGLIHELLAQDKVVVRGMFRYHRKPSVIVCRFQDQFFIDQSRFEYLSRKYREIQK